MGFVPLVYLADEGLPCPRKGLCVLGGDYSIRLDAPEAQELGLFLSQSGKEQATDGQTLRRVLEWGAIAFSVAWSLIIVFSHPGDWHVLEVVL